MWEAGAAECKAVAHGGEVPLLLNRYLPAAMNMSAQLPEPDEEAIPVPDPYS
jgi:hypothetical protein